MGINQTKDEQNLYPENEKTLPKQNKMRQDLNEWKNMSWAMIRYAVF